MKTLKMTDKLLKFINKLISGPNYHCATLLSYDKFIYVMGLNENDLIWIFMKFFKNKTVENPGKTRNKP